MPFGSRRLVRTRPRQTSGSASTPSSSPRSELLLREGVALASVGPGHVAIPKREDRRHIEGFAVELDLRDGAGGLVRFLLQVRTHFHPADQALGRSDHEIDGTGLTHPVPHVTLFDGEELLAVALPLS